MHLIIVVHDGLDGSIVCVINIQVYDLNHIYHVCFWLAKIDSMALFKVFLGSFFIILLIFILMDKTYILQLSIYQ